jgi:GxxExxY protein
VVPNKQAYLIPQGIPTSTDAFASVAPATQGTLIDPGAQYIVFLSSPRIQLSSRIIQAAIAVHKELGPGLLESVYQSCILIELENMGIKAQSQVALPIVYRGQKLDGQGFRLDLLVGDTVVVELKSVKKVEAVHKKQLLTYLWLADKPLGLLINFNESLLKDGITRIINTQDRTE